MSDYLTVTYMPDLGVEPRATFDTHNSIPALYLARQYEGPDVRVQFDSENLADAVRYLRQLAEVAKSLADQVEADGS